MSRLLNTAEAEHFKEKIHNYLPNNEVLEQFKASNFAVIAGPAGAGKDTLRNGLIAKYIGSYVPILSTTTRPPRSGEADGKDYHFREIAEVEKGLNEREFFQAALVHQQQISCLHINEIRKLASNQVGLSILITETEAELRGIKRDIKTIFLIPPDLQTLKSRMQTERMLEESEIERRLTAAKNEITYAVEAEQYYCMVSETIPGVIEKAHAFLQTGNIDTAEDGRARDVMKTMMVELNNE